MQIPTQLKPPAYTVDLLFKMRLILFFFLTCEISDLALVPTSSIPASPVSVISHAGNTTHGLYRVLGVSAPSIALPRLSAKASFGDLVLAVPLVAALSSLAAIVPFKTISVTIPPLSVTATLTAGAWPKSCETNVHKYCKVQYT